MTFNIRRIVTGHDENGKAVIVHDGPAPHVNEFPKRPGFGITQFWVSDTTPASNAGDEDTSERAFELLPPNGGLVFRMLEYPPGEAGHGDAGREAIQQHKIEGAKHAGMHKTCTVDYTVVLSGQTDMELDDSVTRLYAGDVVVQRGTAHAWSNPGLEPCQILFVLVDAEPF